jgi:tetratricopeptide (TPR) repeat protein
VRALHNRGLAYFTRSDYGRAIVDFDDALKHDPGHVEAYSFRGLAHFNTGDLDRAIADYDAAIRLAPQSSQAYYARGRAFLFKGDHGRATADLDQAVRLDPKHPHAYLTRGILHHEKGERGLAAPDLVRAIALYGEELARTPKDPFLRVYRSLAYTLRGEMDRALADASEAIQLDPKSEWAQAGRGFVHFSKGEHDRALVYYDEAIRLQPRNFEALTERGDVFAAKGEPARALIDYEAALAISPGYHRARLARERARAALTAPEAAMPTLTAAALDPGVRVALVIGNSRYTAVNPLPNPTRDAAAVEQKLQTLGFRTVHLARDLTREAMFRELTRFEEEARHADWAVIYYAGHGIEVEGTNYLVPVDARLKAEDDVQTETVPLDHILSAVRGARKMRLVILDACRDNPFVGQMRRTVPGRIGQGLARIEPGGGTLVAYAARHGQIAFDGQGGHSPFVSALLRRLDQGGVEVRRMFGFVRDDVLASTGRRQEPFLYGSIGGEEYFFHVQ